MEGGSKGWLLPIGWVLRAVGGGGSQGVYKKSYRVIEQY